MQHPDTKGYTKGQSSFKVCLYADDALLFITNPLISIPNLLEILDTFANISGLKINISKSVALPINFSSSELNTLKNNFSFI